MTVSAFTHSKQQLRGRLTALLLVVALVALIVDQSTSRAQADTSPATGVPATMSTDALATAQINGVVWSQLIVGSKVYVGGEFTKARPAGAAAGTQEVTRTNMLAYDLATGVLDASFAPTFNAAVRGLAASPDGSRVYAVGNFTSVNGLTRNRVAVFNTSTGGLLNYGASANYTIYGVAATASTVYLAGGFTTMNGVARVGLAAVDAITGGLKTFSVTPAGGSPRQVVVSPDESTVMVGGNFTSMNGSSSPGYGLAAMDAVTGSMKPMPVNSVVRDANTNAAILSMAADSTGFYGSGYAYSKAQGNLEGSFKADWNGNLIWLEDCHGDTYSVAPAGNAVYVAGHPHYCGNLGGFPQTDPNWTYQRGLAFSKDVRGTIAPDIYGYFNFDGRPRPQLLHFLPDINTGTYTGKSQGPWSVTGNADYVLYGGEFTQVNGKAQQGLVRFARSGIAPDKDGPRLSGTNLPIKGQSFAGAIRIELLADYDRDNENLTYDLIRNGSTVASTTVPSSWWERPWVSLLDTAVTQGQTYSYRVRVSDPKGNQVTSPTIDVAAAGGRALDGYDSKVLQSGPDSYWPLDDSSASSVTDVAGRSGASGGASVVTGRPGISSGGKAFGFNGSNSVGSATSAAGPTLFSVEGWFKTTSNKGGKIIGFGSASAGNSPSNDRHIYLTNDGRLRFGVTQTTNKVVGSTSSFNDGKWHQVVGTLDPTGLKLYADGVLVDSRNDEVRGGRYNGYWRIGGDRLSGWPDNPTSGFLTGDIDQPAVYNRALGSQEIKAHWVAGSGTPPANQLPQPTFSVSVHDLSVTADASTSIDPDGTIQSYNWDFGDGTTGTGPQPSHRYAAAGTNTISLTVTDNNGATATASHSVTVTNPPAGPQQIAADAFGRTLSSGWGAADAGGNWTLSSAASGYSVGSGNGQLLLQSPGARRTAYLDATASNGNDVTGSFAVDKLGTIYLSAFGRRVSGASDYRVDVTLNSVGKVNWNLSATRGGTGSKLAPTTTLAQTVQPGDTIRFRVQATGSTPTVVRAKVWVGTRAQEPADWQQSATDATAELQASGTAGVSAYLSTAATNAPVAVGVDDFEVDTTG